MEAGDIQTELLEREIRIKERELELKIAEAAKPKSNWSSPLVVSIMAAALAAASNAWIAFYNAETNRRDARIAAENARILQMLKADTEQAASNLQFLIDTGLVSDPDVRSSLAEYLANRKPGQGPSLAASLQQAETEMIDLVAEVLKEEIYSGAASITELDTNFVMLRASLWLAFDSGKAEVREEFRRGKLPRIAEALKTYAAHNLRLAGQTGRIAVIVHSDAQPLSKSLRWASTADLSGARADAIADVLNGMLPDKIEILAEGRGADDPVCTPAEDRACWPQNRRMEILLERVR